MRVILTEYIYGLGQEGDTVTVTPGFGRNFLIPKGKALRFSEENAQQFNVRRAEIAARLNKLKDESIAVMNFLQEKPFIITTQANEKGQLYGMVRQQNIFAALHADFPCVTKDSIVMSSTIKEVGMYPVQVRLHPEVIINTNVYVFTSEQEALSFIENEKLESERKAKEEESQKELAKKLEEAEKAAAAAQETQQDSASEQEEAPSDASSQEDNQEPSAAE